MSGKKTIKAIPTNYGGFFFRSRLEARWAVYFDAIGWAWNYEVEGFELGGGVRYLPDFWFPKFDLYAEIKREGAPDSEFAKAEAFARAGKNILLLSGPPANRNYVILDGRHGAPSRSSGVLVPLNFKYAPMFVCPQLEGNELSEYQLVTEEACRLAKRARFEFGETLDRENVCATAGWQLLPPAGGHCSSPDGGTA